MKCLHCEKKIGWLKNPVDGLYCTPLCRDEARQELTLRQREATMRLDAEFEDRDAALRAKERERLEIEAALLRGKSEVVVRPDVVQSPCPKCGAPWNHRHGAGGFGRNVGECPGCGFRAEFISIEHCPNCRSHSLIVESQDDARCPRCKSRPRRRRQIA